MVCRERRSAARDARRARGQHVGRPKALDQSNADLARRMHTSGEPVKTIRGDAGCVGCDRLPSRGRSIIAAWCVPLGATLNVKRCYRRAAARCGVAVLANDCGWAGRVDETGLTAAAEETGAVGFAATPRNGFVRGFHGLPALANFTRRLLTMMTVPRLLLGVDDA